MKMNHARLVRKGGGAAPSLVPATDGNELRDLGLERRALGTLLTYPKAIDSAIAEGLSADAFSWTSRHGKIFDAIRALPEDGRRDVLTVEGELRKRGHLEFVGGRQALTDLLEHCQAPENIPSIALELLHLKKLRSLRSTALGVLEAVEDENAHGPRIAEHLKAEAERVLRTGHVAGVATHNPTDLGNAERLAVHAAGRLRYCHPWQRWVVWDGRRWAADSMGAAVVMAKDTVRSIYGEAENAPDEIARKSLGLHAARSENQRRIAGMLELAKSDPRIAIAPEQFDSPETLNLLTVLNGTLDLRTGALRPHDPADFITRLVPVEYRPGAHSLLWEGFLADVLPDAEVRAYMQRFAGYALTGQTGEQVFALLHGLGANGKSTFLETLTHMLGDYAYKAEFSTFQQSKGDQVRKGGARADVVQLAGKRLVIANENAEGRALDVATVKELTGGDTVTARGLYQSELTQFRPEAKLILAANHKPRIPDNTESIWRRIHEVPFTVTIPEEKRDTTLAARLREPNELAGVLAWALEGCRLWCAIGGLNPPAAVLSASRAYRSQEDFLEPFLEAKCVTSDLTVKSLSATLFRAYEAWCKENDEAPETQKAFGIALEEHGFKRVRISGGARAWVGLRLADMLDSDTG